MEPFGPHRSLSDHASLFASPLQVRPNPRLSWPGSDTHATFALFDHNDDDDDAEFELVIVSNSQRLVAIPETSSPCHETPVKSVGPSARSPIIPLYYPIDFASADHSPSTVKHAKEPEPAVSVSFNQSDGSIAVNSTLPAFETLNTGLLPGYSKAVRGQRTDPSPKAAKSAGKRAVFPSLAAASSMHVDQTDHALREESHVILKAHKPPAPASPSPLTPRRSGRTKVARGELPIYEYEVVQDCSGKSVVVEKIVGRRENPRVAYFESMRHRLFN